VGGLLPFALVLAGGLTAGSLHGQERGAIQDPATVGAAPSQARASSVAPSARAGARTGEIRIDGRLSEEAWAEAPVIFGFVQREPFEGAPAEEDTQVRILFDDDAIYVAARMFEADTSRIRRPLVRRGQGGAFQDWFSVALDPNRDGITGYRFQVNAAGVQVDWYDYDDHRSDGSWNGVWESAVQVDSLGWTAEIRIPLSQIRFEAGAEPQTWGLQLQRRRSAAGEVSQFALQRQALRGVVSQYGRLEGIHLSSPARRMEVRPYVLSSYHRAPAVDGDPFFGGREMGGQVGSDLRVGLGSAFTLDATLNPDFGQVEADPSELNLTAFESFFREQRPFFIEDAQVFEFNLSGRQNRLFYSRRIGRAPQIGAPSGADFVHVPGVATIDAAAKITGRTSGGFSVGFLGAHTRKERGRAYFRDEGHLRSFLVEPATRYGALSAQQDLNRGASQVRGLVTGVHRALPEEGALPLAEGAVSGGLAFLHQWRDRTWRLEGFAAVSHVRGGPEALTGLQRSSTHYFQRPDATRVTLDPDRSSLTGAEWQLRLDRQNREHWTGSAWIGQITPGFDVRDLGFSRNRERLAGGMNYGYRQLRPGPLFRSWEVEFSSFHNFSHEALDHPGSWRGWREAYTDGKFELESEFTLLNYHGGGVSVRWQPDLFSRTATRGGPVMLDPAQIRGRLGLQTDRRQDTSFNGGIGLARGTRGSGGEVSLDGTLNVRPSPRLQLEFGPRISAQTDAVQYVAATSAVPFEATYGSRYFFGELDLRTLALQARANYTFSPNLSLQAYAEPFLSSGDYVGYRQLASPATYEFLEFEEGEAVGSGTGTVCVGGRICQGEDGLQHLDLTGDGRTDFSFRDRDFLVRSLVGNAVLRWEYRPGSTVYLVWQRQQEMHDLADEIQLRRDLRGLLTAPASDRVILKVNYWLNL
jgi:hypothetical protein